MRSIHPPNALNQVPICQMQRFEGREIPAELTIAAIQSPNWVSIEP
jgi:hypothetical protein